MNKIDRINFRKESRQNIKGNVISLYAANLLMQLLIGLGVLSREYYIVSIIILVLTSVLEFGLALFYIEYLVKGELNYKVLFVSYRKGIIRFIRHLITYAIKYIVILLASTLLLIPGLIKRYSYSQVKYIRATFPDIGVIKCLLMSKRIMRWHKLELFYLDMTFVLWFLAAPLTGGLLLLYLVPYYNTTMARYHLYLKSRYDFNKAVNRHMVRYFVKCLAKIN